MMQVNDKLVFDDGTCLNSKLIAAARDNGVAEAAYMTLANEYLKNPRPIFFREISTEDEARQGYLKMLKDSGGNCICASHRFILIIRSRESLKYIQGKKTS